MRTEESKGGIIMDQRDSCGKSWSSRSECDCDRIKYGPTLVAFIQSIFDMIRTLYLGSIKVGRSAVS